MGYSAGTLDLSVLGTSESAVASIDRTVKSLNSLSRAVNKINNAGFYSASVHLENLFNKLAKSTNAINTTNISHLASAAKSLSALSKIGNLQNVNWDTISAGFGKLTTAITPFVEKAKEAEVSLTALNGIVSKVSSKKIGDLLNGSNGSSTSKSKSFSLAGLFNLGKWTAIIHAAMRLGRCVAKIVQSGSAYTETLNLWETSMGNNLNVATEFVNKMNEAYGISEKTLMNAQAIFKNMLGSLGQISDSMAYSLSEGITQMALDYASLYNVTFEQAFTKFQAALAGQVRPIRSVAGYDITENTLFQLYQSLGGQKTMRQLSRTEKQLLSIYAVFRQMDASGAIGDLDKTMESFANQSRVWAESWQRVMTYSGVILTHLIEQSGFMTYLNAVLIFLGDTLKAVAESMGAIKSFGDPFESTTEGALDASNAIDEVKGKLLDFDKFRSLSGQNENALGLDEKLLAALSNFDSILEGSSMAAQQLAEQLKIASGIFDESGVFNPDRWREISDAIEGVGSTLLVSIGFVTVGMKLLNIEFLRLIALKITTLIPVITTGFANLGKTLMTVKGFAGFALGSLLAFSVLDTLFSNLSDDGKKLVGVLAIILGTIITISGAIKGGFAGAAIAGLGFGAILAGIKATADGFDLFAEGGLPDKGTMFVAGEAGAEMVYNMSSGQSGVANIQQIKAAHSQALKEWWATAKHDIPAFQGVSDSGLYTIVDGEAKRRGKRFANV